MATLNNATDKMTTMIWTRTSQTLKRLVQQSQQMPRGRRMWSEGPLLFHPRHSMRTQKMQQRPQQTTLQRRQKFQQNLMRTVTTSVSQSLE